MAQKWDNTPVKKHGQKSQAFNYQPLWSVTEIDHLGNSYCYGHYGTHGQALVRIDFQDPYGSQRNLRIYTHLFNHCCYCGYEVNK